MFFGTDIGQVHVFSAASPNDNGNQIAYSFTPGYITLDPRTNLLLDSWEFYLKQNNAFELVTVEFDYRNSPYGAVIPVTAFPMDVSDERTWAIPKALPTQSVYGRFLQLVISGYSFQRGLAYGGGNVFYQKQERPSNK